MGAASDALVHGLQGVDETLLTSHLLDRLNVRADSQYATIRSLARQEHGEDCSHTALGVRRCHRLRGAALSGRPCACRKRSLDITPVSRRQMAPYGKRQTASQVAKSGVGLRRRRLSYQNFCRMRANMFGKTTSRDRPGAPASLPQYLCEGVPKQDNQTLRELQTWIKELLEYRHDITAEEIEVAEGETVTDVDDSGGTTTVIKKVPCGKDTCSTCPHGPYRYEVHREGDKLVWDYEGPVDSQD